MPRTIEQTITFHVPPGRLSRLSLNARKHEAACGGWGKARRAGSRLAMVHANVPEANAQSIGSVAGGWHGHSWRPWKASLRKRPR